MEPFKIQCMRPSPEQLAGIHGGVTGIDAGLPWTMSFSRTATEHGRMVGPERFEYVPVTGEYMLAVQDQSALQPETCFSDMAGCLGIKLPSEDHLAGVVEKIAGNTIFVHPSSSTVKKEDIQIGDGRLLRVFLYPNEITPGHFDQNGVCRCMQLYGTSERGRRPEFPYGEGTGTDLKTVSLRLSVPATLGTMGERRDLLRAGFNGEGPLSADRVFYFNGECEDRLDGYMGQVTTVVRRYMQQTG